MARSPVYFLKNQEPVLSKKRENQINAEKSRVKRGAVSVVAKLNDRLMTAFSANDMDRCFDLAFRLERYIASHCAHFLTRHECQLFFGSLYNIIGEFYFSAKILNSVMSTDKIEQRIYCMLGSELSDFHFSQDIARSIMPHVGDKRAHRRDIEQRLEVAVSSLERTFLYHELAMCLSGVRQAELSMKAAQKGLLYAKDINHKVWCTNNAFLIARANFLIGDLEDAREVLTSSLNRVQKIGRSDCVSFLEKVIAIIKREESRPFQFVSPVKKRQRQIIDCMPNLDMKIEAAALFRKIDSLPADQRFHIMPKAEETRGDRKASRKALVTPLKRKIVNAIKGTNACEGPKYSNASAIFVV